MLTSREEWTFLAPAARAARGEGQETEPRPAGEEGGDSGAASTALDEVEVAEGRESEG